MAGLFKLNDLEERKQALAAEAEVFRQALTLELQNLRLYAVQARRSMSKLSVSNPLMVLGAAMAGSMLKRRRFGRMRLVTVALLGWQFYQRIFVPLRSLLPRGWARSPQRAGAIAGRGRYSNRTGAENNPPAANI